MNAWWYFGLTLLIELPVIFLFFRDRWNEVVIPFLLLNLFTWPLLHYFLLTTDLPVPFLELGVATTEMIGYKLLMKCSWKKSFAASFVANGISYDAGILINNYFL